MADFKIHTPETAPADAKKTLDRTRETFGMVPNLLGVLAEAPAAAKAYLDLHDDFAASSFTPTEQQVVTLTTSFENGCHYCMAAESAGAKAADVDADVIEALRSGSKLPNERLQALRRFTRVVVEERGWVDDEEIQRFLSAGFEKRHVLEVVLGVTKKTLSNYVNHLAETPVDAAFREFEWTRPEPARTG